MKLGPHPLCRRRRSAAHRRSPPCAQAPSAQDVLQRALQLLPLLRYDRGTKMEGVLDAARVFLDAAVSLHDQAEQAQISRGERKALFRQVGTQREPGCPNACSKSKPCIGCTVPLMQGAHRPGAAARPFNTASNQPQLARCPQCAMIACFVADGCSLAASALQLTGKQRLQALRGMAAALRSSSRALQADVPSEASLVLARRTVHTVVVNLRFTVAVALRDQFVHHCCGGSAVLLDWLGAVGDALARQPADQDTSCKWRAACARRF